MNQIIKREATESELNRQQAISSNEMLTVEDEVELIKRIRHGEGDVEAAKEKLMRANQRFVLAVAQCYVSDKHSLGELITEGNLGLEHAIYKFDETKGFKFITYAIWWIRQSIQEYIVAKAKEEIVLQDLSKRELDILRMYFGLCREKASLEEIQAKYGLKAQRVLYIKNKALRKLFKSKN